MRIGILTLPIGINYGGILQAWALQTVLTRMGHDVKVLDYERELSKTRILKYPCRAFRKYILKETCAIRQEELSLIDYHNKTSVTLPFIERHINRLFVKNLNGLSDNEFDAIVIGSDQIWRPAYARSHWGMDNAFGKFAIKKGMKVLSYAASFGKDNLDEFNQIELRAITNLLSEYTGISVREKEGVNLCATLGCTAHHVLDPTLLLGKDDYANLFKDQKPYTPHIMAYILDRNDLTDKLTDEFRKKFHLDAFNPVEDSFPKISVEDWLRGFQNSSFVLTDSFHACVFAIIFQRPFAVVLNETRGTSRVKSLLKLLDLENHIISPTERINSIDSYSVSPKAYAKLCESRTESIEFLYSALDFQK